MNFPSLYISLLSKIRSLFTIFSRISSLSHPYLSISSQSLYAHSPLIHIHSISSLFLIDNYIYKLYLYIGLNAFLTPYVCHGSNFGLLLKKTTFQPPNFAPFYNS